MFEVLLEFDGEREKKLTLHLQLCLQKSQDECCSFPPDGFISLEKKKQNGEICIKLQLDYK